MRYISDYRDGDRFSETYLCKTKTIAQARTGKNFYSLTLQDKTGTIDAKIWDLSSGIDNFEVMDYIHCDGVITTFQGNLQMNINRVRVSDEGEYNPADYVPCSKKDINEMYAELMKYIESVQNKYLSALLKMFFVEDKDFIDSFKKHSAAKSVHHSFMGGLLEHTLSVAKLCDFYSKSYPRINRDLLISAAIFHDIGKTKELHEFPLNDYSDLGQLLGHIYEGAKEIENAAANIPNFPERLKNELVHCILAHHGKMEWGSPKNPALLEAMALHMADNTDAKLETMIEIFDGAGDNKEWLGYQRFLETNVRQTIGE